MAKQKRRSSDGNDDVFMRITNKDIYAKLIKIEKHVIETNGKVKLNTYKSTMAIMGVVGLAGWIFYILGKF